MEYIQAWRWKGANILKVEKEAMCGYGKSSTGKLAEKDAKDVSRKQFWKGLEIHAKKCRLYSEDKEGLLRVFSGVR